MECKQGYKEVFRKDKDTHLLTDPITRECSTSRLANEVTGNWSGSQSCSMATPPMQGCALCFSNGMCEECTNSELTASQIVNAYGDAAIMCNSGFE